MRTLNSLLGGIIQFRGAPSNGVSSVNVEKKYMIPNRPESPLDHAARKHDEPILKTVQRAIENKQVLLAYQPIVHANQPDRAAFYEGLIRVIDDTQEVIEAKNFIPIVETLELGRLLDCYALDLGLEALAAEPTLRLSINMSARSIGYPDWMETLEDGLAKDPTAAERLILEITEGSAMLMPDIVNVFMSSLHRRGITFALDDFGAGYTAFRFFKQFQFDIVKIDGQFIKGIDKDADNQVLTQALASIAQQFDMFTVAEHIETAEEMEYLQKAGIDCLQGYYLGRPQVVPEWTEAKYKIANFA